MGGKLKRPSSAIADARLYPLRERYMDPVAGNKIAHALGDTNDRPAGLKLFAGDAVIAIALQVNSCFTRFGLVVEPDLAAQLFTSAVLFFGFFIVHSIRVRG